MNIRTCRIYDTPKPQDGTRILVDGLWPRGISKEQAHLDGWHREIAPSRELRQWFGHDPCRWEGFKQRYFAELDTKRDALSALMETNRGGQLTLLFAARDPAYNNAVALREYLLRTSTGF